MLWFFLHFLSPLVRSVILVGNHFAEFAAFRSSAGWQAELLLTADFWDPSLNFNDTFFGNSQGFYNAFLSYGAELLEFTFDQLMIPLSWLRSGQHSRSGRHRRRSHRSRNPGCGFSRSDTYQIIFGTEFLSGSGAV